MALENHFKQERSINNRFLNYKVLHFTSYFSKPNYVYLFVLVCLCILFVIMQFFFSILLIFISSLLFYIPEFSKKNIIVLTSSKKPLFQAINQLNFSSNDFIFSKSINLLIRISKKALFNYLFFFFHFTFYVIKQRYNWFLFFLNYKDLLNLYLLSNYLIENPKLSVFSDDHYQRNAFIVSNLQGQNYYVLQHGFIDDSIKFPKRFGKINSLLIYDLSYLNKFKCYFDVVNHAIVKTNSFCFSKRSDLKNTCFIASSSPYVDFEIEFAKLFKSRYRFKIILKKHPKHVYDTNKFREFEKIFDEEWLDEECFPNSGLFISYASFLETYYKSNGINTFNLKSYSKIEDIFQDALFLESIETLQLSK